MMIMMMMMMMMMMLLLLLMLITMVSNHMNFIFKIQRLYNLLRKKRRRKGFIDVILPFRGDDLHYTFGVKISMHVPSASHSKMREIGCYTVLC